MKIKIKLDSYQKFQAVIFTIFILPILAPIFLALGINPVAQVIYFVYSFSCHQLAHRSLYIYDHQCAWCARDTFIWAGIGLSTIFVRKFDIRNFKVTWVLPFMIPIALDGGIQTIATFFGLTNGNDFYTSTSFIRALTGAFFGIGIGFFLSTMINGAAPKKEQALPQPGFKKYLKYVGVMMSILMVFYTAFIQVWSATSPEHKPANFLDHEVKTPVDETKWIRQIDGGCKPDEPKYIAGGTSLNSFAFTPQDCIK